MATQSITTNTPNNRSDAPMSRSRNSTASDVPHASSSGPEVLQARQPEPADAGGEQLAALGEVGGEEDHDQQAPELGRLELDERRG